MSVAADGIAEAPISAQLATASSSKKPPRHRQTVAKSDQVAQPEAR